MPRTSRIHILLVEDEPVDVMTMRRAVRERALDVELHVVASAEEAMAWLGLDQPEAPAPAASPELVIADLRLPRLSGLDLLDRIKANPSLVSLPVIILSTSTREVELARAYRSGVAGFFGKPVSFDESADLFERIVRYWSCAQPAEVSATPAPSLHAQHLHYLESELRALMSSDRAVFDFFQRGATDGVWYWDLCEPEHQWMSPAFWTTFGYDPKTKPHLASSWQDVIDPDDLRVVLANLEKHWADPAEPYDQTVRYRSATGETVWIRCRGMAIRDPAGKPVRMLGVHQDVTKQREAETALLEARRRLDEIESLVAAPTASTALDPERLRAIIRSVLD